MSGEREVSAARTRVLVRHLRRVYGAQALARVLELGAWERTPAELEDTNAWFSEAESSALFEAAASVTGDPDIARAAGDEADAEQTAAYLEAQLAGLGERFQSLQRIAIDLAGARDTDAALETILRGAGAAVRAPRFVLAVRVNQEDRLRVHSLGIDAAHLDGIVAEILADNPDDHLGSRLVVDVVSTDGHFGRLAALYPDKARFFAQERMLLETYAAHAAAALGMAAALDAAHRRDIMARTLLELAHSLADLATPSEIAAKIVLAARQIVDCDVASMWVVDQATGEFLLAATDGWDSTPVTTVAGVRIAPQTALIAELFATREPRFLPAALDDPVLAPIFQVTSSVAIVVVPILSKDTFLGAVTVGVHDDASRLQGNTEANERLLGLARHAASALENASLLEQVRAQALRDALTGLPNRRLLDDRIEQALKQAQRDGRRAAVLFLDVDRFKDINDSFGHATGDDVLRTIADRLTNALRAQDTAARVGGDEFAILLPDISHADDASGVAASIATELSMPIVIRNQPVFVSASVGVAVYPDDGVSLDQLMRAADGAMYLNKDGERHSLKVVGGVTSSSQSA